MTNRSPVLEDAPVRPTESPDKPGGGDLQVSDQTGGQDAAPETEGEPPVEAEEQDGEAEPEDPFMCEPCEEVEPLRKPPMPKLPSAAEIEDHRRCRIP